MAQTYGDIRLRFESAMRYIAEKNSISNVRDFFASTYNSYVKQINYSGSLIKPSTGEVLRADLGLDGESMLSKMLIDAGLQPGSFDVSTLGKGERGSKSGTFDTVQLDITKDQIVGGANFLKGDTFYIVNRVSFKNGQKGVIGKKDLTPDKLGITKNDYTTIDTLISYTNNSIQNLSIPDNYKMFLFQMMDEIRDANISKYDTLTEMIESNQNSFDVNFTENLVLKYQIDPISLANISNDFGEILGGIFLFNSVSNSGTGVSYPKSSNAAMVDFIFDDWKISSKAGKKGGVPTLTALASEILYQYKTGTLLPSEEEQSVINNLLEVIKNPGHYFKEAGSKRESSIFSTYMALANTFLLGNNGGYDYFLKESGIQWNNIGRESINAAMDKAYEDDTLWDLLSQYFKLTNTYPSGYASKSAAMKSYKNDSDNEDRFGIIFYPLMKEVIEELNYKYDDAISTLINKVSTIQQLYLIVNPKSSTVNFKIKSFDTANFKFAVKGSAKNPLNGQIGIESL